MKQITDEQFDRVLAAIIDKDNVKPSQLLSIAGIYEILSEHYNNDVLEAIERGEFE